MEPIGALIALPVVLFIHGAGGGGWEWKLWIPEFEAAGYRCLAPDLDPSSGGIAETSVADYVDQVRRWAQGIGDATFVIVGASMGGILALKAAEVVSPLAVVLVNSVGPAGTSDRAEMVWPEVIEWSKGTREESVSAMPDSDEAIVDLAYRSWHDESGRVLNELGAGVDVVWPTVPVLVLASELDEDVPVSVAHRIAARWPVELEVMGGMGHLSPLLGRSAPAIARRVLSWLERTVR